MTKSRLYPMTHRMMRLAGPISVLKLNLQMECHRIRINSTSPSQYAVLLLPLLNQGFSQKCPCPRSANHWIPTRHHLRFLCVWAQSLRTFGGPCEARDQAALRGSHLNPTVTGYLTWRVGSWWTHSAHLLIVSKILVMTGGDGDRNSSRIAQGSRSKPR